jgi:HAE1 family hydrophobic/amphiphilic exporter-1
MSERPDGELPHEPVHVHVGWMSSALPRFGVERPVSVMVLFLALMVLGFIAWTRIPLTMLPDGFEPKFLWVQIPFQNASPRESDELVVRPIAEQLSTVSGIKQLRTRAGTDSTGFSIEFHPSVDMDDAYNDVVDRIERAMPDLPSDVERYFVFKYNPSDEPILWAGATFPDAVEDPYELMQRVVIPRIERIPGVASVDLWGVNSRAIYIDWDRDALMEHGVSINQVQQQLAADNFQRSGGRIDDGGVVRHVRSLARIDDVATLEAYPIQNGRLHLSDVAEITYRKTADADIDRVDGKRSAAFGVRKESSANTVEVGAQIQKALAELAVEPRAQGSAFFTFFDQGEQIAEATDNLGQSLMEGALLSVLVLYIFLREWRMTLLISLAIPFSLMITLAALYFRGTSLNLVAMMGLMLSVGMVVDNAVVVIEAIYQRRTRKESLRDAAVHGASDVALALLAATGASVIVFLPVILMSEDATASFFLTELGLPVIFALIASLGVAMVFAPLASTLLGQTEIRENPAWLTWFTGHYLRLLRWTLHHPADTAISILAMFMLTVGIAVPGVQCTGEGNAGLNDFEVGFSVPREANHAERDAIARKFEDLLEAHRAEWQVRVYRVEIGIHDTEGTLWIYLEDEAPKDDIVKKVKDALPQEIPGVVASVSWGQGQTDDRVTIPVFGEDLVTLQGLGEEIARRARDVPGVISANLDTEKAGLEELVLHPDRNALHRFGVDARTVAFTVAFALRGNSALPPIIQGEHEIEVVSRLSDDDRANISTLLDFPVFSATSGQVVPVRALADTEFGRGPGTIRRTNRRTSLEVTLDLAKDASAESVGPLLEAALADLEPPRGYSVDTDTWKRDQSETDEATLFAFGMSVVFVYLLMGILFESWLLPLSLITTIPMALLGAWWGLYLTDSDMDVMAGVGLIVLVGIVVNHGIVLVDRIEAARAEGFSREDAISDACQTRLRPILMTALTTILGLVPMAFGSSDFIGIPYAPLGRCVMGGMVASTVLMLLYVPFIYTLLDELAAWGRRLWAELLGRTA